MFYRIGDIARWLNVKPHVVRFWQEEFKAFCHVGTSKAGQRVFSRRDVAIFAAIRELLYTEMYTVEGAKRQLRLAAERERQVG